jgi:hypothetical protein
MPHIITCTNNHLFRKEESLVLLFIQFLVDPSLLAAANSLRRFVCAQERYFSFRLSDGSRHACVAGFLPSLPPCNITLLAPVKL